MPTTPRLTNQVSRSPHFNNDTLLIKGTYYQGITSSSSVVDIYKPGVELILEREPGNPYDPNAVLILIKESQSQFTALGYIPRESAKRLAPILDRGSDYSCLAKSVRRTDLTPTFKLTLKTFPVVSNTITQRINSLSQNRFPDSRLKGPTGKQFRMHTNFHKWTKQFDNVAGIYVIWDRNHTCYIGQSLNVGERWRHHFNALVLNNHANSALQDAWNENGEKFFRFDLLQADLPELLNILEKHYIQHFDSYKQGYNQTENGQGKDFECFIEGQPSLPEINAKTSPSLPTPQVHEENIKHENYSGLSVPHVKAALPPCKETVPFCQPPREVDVSHENTRKAAQMRSGATTRSTNPNASLKRNSTTSLHFSNRDVRVSLNSAISSKFSNIFSKLREELKDEGWSES